MEPRCLKALYPSSHVSRQAGRQSKFFEKMGLAPTSQKYSSIPGRVRSSPVTRQGAKYPETSLRSDPGSHRTDKPRAEKMVHTMEKPRTPPSAEHQTSLSVGSANIGVLAGEVWGSEVQAVRCQSPACLGGRASILPCNHLSQQNNLAGVGSLDPKLSRLTLFQKPKNAALSIARTGRDHLTKAFWDRLERAKTLPAAHRFGCCGFTGKPHMQPWISVKIADSSGLGNSNQPKAQHCHDLM